MSFSSRVERIRSCKSSLVLSSLWHPTPDWVIPSCRCTPYLYFPEVVSPFDWQLCISSLPRSTPRSRWVVHKWAPVDFASANNIMVWHWALRVPPRAKRVSSTVGPAWPVGEQTKLPSHTAGGGGTKVHFPISRRSSWIFIRARPPLSKSLLCTPSPTKCIIQRQSFPY